MTKQRRQWVRLAGFSFWPSSTLCRDHFQPTPPREGVQQ